MPKRNMVRDLDGTMFPSMVDAMPVNVMVADPVTFNITYMSELSRKTLSKLEHLLPVPLNEVEGQCIDIFHKTRPISAI